MTSRAAHTLHAPYNEHVLTTVEAEAIGKDLYPRYGEKQTVTLVVHTLMNGVREAEYHHDHLLTLVASYCDHIAANAPLGPHEPDFIMARAVVSHMVSDRETGSSIETWPWIHDMVDLVIMRALNTHGLRLPHGGPWEDGYFPDATSVTSTWPQF